MPVKWKDLLAGLPNAVEEAIETASREAAEALNQAIRLIAQSPTVSDALAALVDSTPSFCGVATVLSLKDGHAQIIKSKGTTATNATFEISDCPVLATLLDTKEPVAAVATPAQLSPVLLEALAGPGDKRAYLFPLKVRQEVVAALAAAGTVHPGAVECLCEAASLKLEILLPPPPPPSRPPADQGQPAPTKEAKRQ